MYRLFVNNKQMPEEFSFHHKDDAERILKALRKLCLTTPGWWDPFPEFEVRKDA